MRSNLVKIYISNFLTGLVFWYGIEKLFMKGIGIDAFGIGVNAVVLVATNTLFDVPMGILADRWSRKYTLVGAFAMLGISSWLLGASNGLTMYLIGTVIYGLYLCMSNGTYQAIIYDTVHELGRPETYAKHQGASYGLFMFGVALSSLAGGYMAQHFGYRSTYYWSAVLCIFNVLLILSIREPAFHKLQGPLHLRSHIGSTVRSIISSRTVLFLSSVIIMVGLLRSTLNEYAGLYFIAIGFGAVGSGAANSGKWLAGSIGQFVSRYLVRWLPWLTILFFVAFAVMSTWRSVLGIIFFYVCTFTYSTVQNETQAQLQHTIDDSVRATVLSLLNWATNALLVPLGLLFGWLAQRYDVFRAYQLFAVIGLGYLIIWAFLRRPLRMMAPVPDRDIAVIK